MGGAPIGGGTLVGGAPKMDLFELETFGMLGLLVTYLKLPLFGGPVDG